MFVGKTMPGKAVTHGRDPFIFGGWLTEADSPEDSGLGEEKHRLLATVICAGKEIPGSELAERAHCSDVR